MKTKLLLLVFIISTGFLLNAQNDYNFNVANETYQNLTGSTSLNNGQVWDDPGYVIPLGFNFQMGPHNFNTIYIVDWSVGGVLSSSAVDSGILPLLVPIAQDIIDLGFGSGVSQSPISYKTEGAAGSQILKIEWNNVGFFDDQTGSDFMNFQLWFYEDSNIVEYRYGSSQINNPQGSFEGETGPNVVFVPSINVDTFILDEDAYFLSGNPTNPTVNVVMEGDSPQTSFAFQGMIPNGTVYTFTPQNLSVDNFESLGFSIYPNPATHLLNIHSNDPDYTIEIYSSMGQKIHGFSEVNGTVDVSSLSSGIYLVRILTGNASAIQKLVKQ